LLQFVTIYLKKSLTYMAFSSYISMAVVKFGVVFRIG